MHPTCYSARLMAFIAQPTVQNQLESDVLSLCLERRKLPQNKTIAERHFTGKGWMPDSWLRSDAPGK